MGVLPGLGCVCWSPAQSGGRGCWVVVKLNLPQEQGLLSLVEVESAG